LGYKSKLDQASQFRSAGIRTLTVSGFVLGYQEYYPPYLPTVHIFFLQTELAD